MLINVNVKMGLQGAAGRVNTCLITGDASFVHPPRGLWGAYGGIARDEQRHQEKKRPSSGTALAKASV